MVVNTDEAKIEDPTLKSLCTDKENCFRATLIAALGGTVQQSSTLCCVTCNPLAFTNGERLDVMQVGKTPPRKKRRVAVRNVDKSTIETLKVQLKAEREKYMSENPSLHILGNQFVCPDSVIEKCL